MATKPKILFFDIETLPIEALVWSKWMDGPVAAVKKDWQLLSFAWKFQGEEVQVISRREKSERTLVSALHKLLNSADVVVAHNGDRFDIKKSNAKFIEFGLLPPKPPQTVDTKKAAKRYFAFTGNSLDELGQLLGVGRKIKHEGIELWKKCKAGDEKALLKMERYNKGDVRLLERVYNKLLPWIGNHPNVALLSGKDAKSCPNCTSSRIKSEGIRATTQRVYRRLLCLGCGARFQGKLEKKKAAA